jgi:hypothetical protein
MTRPALSDRWEIALLILACAAVVAAAADLERRVAAGEATQEDLDRARRRAAEAAAEATQARERADRARAWTVRVL